MSHQWGTTQQRYVELMSRPADPEAIPGRPQGQLTLPDGDLLVPQRRGAQQYRRLRRCREWTGIAPAPTWPDVLAGVVWDERPDRPDRRGLRVIATLDRPTEHIVAGGAHHLLHVSLSYPEHLPAWWEVVAIKDAVFGPNVDACLILPRASDDVNIQPFTLQLWQMPRVWGGR